MQHCESVEQGGLKTNWMAWLALHRISQRAKNVAGKRDELLRDFYGIISSQRSKFFKGVSSNAFDVALHRSLGLFTVPGH
jgi:hypothetical protein